ncbi:MAG TPA: hypothetical protein PL151_19015 [Phycisphaerae bacterium]|nr:hypothetical protein [Phycisphaerae bacterium]HOJ73393.1 hypothetical protein [Phycisphaerae bacterium]HOM51002.1 hypothetical protein [Phycisphaerae bacterium]HON66360.1 hypothetical protein [Phycisphaerae bacterium]HOQ86728.1 hypothetical protein [Phycisphaerae bacterium]
MAANDNAPDQSSLAGGVKIGVVILALISVVYFVWIRGGEEGQADTPDSAAPYFCLECNKPFSLTPAGYQRLSKSGGIKTITPAEGRRGQVRFRCPQCEKFGGVPALVCPKDQTSFANIAVKGEPNKCPTCGWSP